VWKLLEKIFSPPKSAEQERVEHATALAMADYRRVGLTDPEARRETMRAVGRVMDGASRLEDQYQEVECPRTGACNMMLTPEGRFDVVRSTCGVVPSAWAEERWAKWAGQTIWDLYRV
jgi:hypothetical protein